MERKISKCINVRVNVGNYQHIELTEYAEEKIEYSSKEELREKEQSLMDDLTGSLFADINLISSKLDGKGNLQGTVQKTQQLKESIFKKLPEWIANTPEPNIANKSLDSHEKNVIEQFINKNSGDDKGDLMDDILEVKSEVKSEVKKDLDKELDDSDLFEDVKDDLKNNKKVDDDLFDEDDDLFADIL